MLLSRKKLFIYITIELLVLGVVGFFIRRDETMVFFHGILAPV